MRYLAAVGQTTSAGRDLASEPHNRSLQTGFKWDSSTGYRLRNSISCAKYRPFDMLAIINGYRCKMAEFCVIYSTFLSSKV